MSERAEREIHVLCGAVSPPSRVRFESEAAALRRTVRWLDPHAVSRADSGLTCDGVPLPLPEVALARSGGYTSDRALDILHAYEEFGVTVVDSAEAVERCRDKLVATGLLAASSVPVPLTVAVGGAGGVTSAASAMDLLGAPPLVFKPARGMKGAGVRLVEDPDDLQAAMRAEGPLLVQEYVPHGFDIRVIVVGGVPLGSIRRVAVEDFRSNLHAGARPEAIELDEDAARLAVEAAAALGAEVAGIDLLPREGGFVVLEVNASPGFEGFEEATGLNVARDILTHALAIA